MAVPIRPKVSGDTFLQGVVTIAGPPPSPKQRPGTEQLKAQLTAANAELRPRGRLSPFIAKKMSRPKI